MDIKNKKNILIIVIILLFLLILPVIPQLNIFYSWIISQDKYYTVIIGIFAIILGCFYYFHRITVDTNIKKIEFRRQILNLLLDAFNKFDMCVYLILTKEIKSAHDLFHLRSMLRNRMFAVIEILKHVDKIVEFSENEKKQVFEAISYIDKSNTIMSIAHDKFINEPVANILDQYCIKFGQAKEICFQKLTT